MTASNAAVDKKDVEKIEKSHEKLAEKRRALGRGLESLLPGPRVVAAPTLPQSARKDGPPDFSSGADGGRARAPVASLSDAPVKEAPPTMGIVDRVQASAAWHAPEGDHPFELAMEQIEQNPYQTRREFDQKAIEELAASIRVQGVLQPIVVRPRPVLPEDPADSTEQFILILGERRLRASKLAGRTTIPAIVKRVSEQQAAEMTLVENLQRQDLNCMEQAEAFGNLSTRFKLTQEEIGARAGLSRESVSNYMRLLTLPEGVIGALQKGKLTYSHARVLLQLRDNVQIWKWAVKAMEEKMSVARLEDLVIGVSAPTGLRERSKGGGARWVDPNVKAAQRSLEEVLGMKVRIRDWNGRGKIVIEYAMLEDFDRVVRMLKGK
jgi:ParB family chromosome partitioning protein